MNLKDLNKKLNEVNSNLDSKRVTISDEELKQAEKQANKKNLKRGFVTIMGVVFFMNACSHASNTPTETNKTASESVKTEQVSPVKTNGHYTTEYNEYSKQDLTAVPTAKRNAMVVAMDSTGNDKVKVATYMLMLDAKGNQKGIATKEDMTKEGISFNEYKQALDSLTVASHSEIQSHNVGQMWVSE